MLRISSLPFMLCCVPAVFGEAMLPLPEIPAEVGVSAERHRAVLNEKATLEKRLQEKEQQVTALEVALKKLQTIPRVCVEDFRLAKTEVTVGEFRRFVEATSYVNEAEKTGGRWVFGDGK